MFFLILFLLSLRYPEKLEHQEIPLSTGSCISQDAQGMKRKNGANDIGSTSPTPCQHKLIPYCASPNVISRPILI